MRTIQKVIAAIMMLAVMSACQKDPGIEPVPSDNGNQDPPKAKTIAMNSNPDNSSTEFEHFYVDIDKVEAYFQGEGWVSLTSEDQTVDLNALFDKSVHILAKVADSAFARIEKIRLTFGSENHLVLNGGADINFAVLGGKEYVIDIEHDASAETSILLNMDLNGAIVSTTLGYAWTPIINFLEDPETGISGHIEGASQAIISLDNGNLSLQTYLDGEGDFRIQDVDPGFYELTVRPFLNDIGGQLQETQVVVIVDGQTTFISDITFN